MRNSNRAKFQLVAVNAIFALAITGIAAVAACHHANAHEATSVAGQPLGWSYPWACCSNMDCQPVGENDVTEGPDGYQVAGSSDQTPIPYGDKRIKDSPDGEFHWCAHRSGIDSGHTICLFVPPKGF